MQLTLGGSAVLELDPHFSDLRRTELAHDAWIEHAAGWLRGHQQLFDHLLDRADWRTETRVMYGREVVTPRLVASVPEPAALHPIIERMRQQLGARYGEEFRRVSLALYRGGNDSVAYHGDTIARDLPDAIVATVTLGSARRMRLKPTVGTGSVQVTLGGGDLFVMGGTSQRTWRHGIAKVAQAGPRIALMFRPVWTEPTRRDREGAFDRRP